MLISNSYNADQDNLRPFILYAKEPSTSSSFIHTMKPTDFRQLAQTMLDQSLKPIFHKINELDAVEQSLKAKISELVTTIESVRRSKYEYSDAVIRKSTNISFSYIEDIQKEYHEKGFESEKVRTFVLDIMTKFFDHTIPEYEDIVCSDIQFNSHPNFHNNTEIVLFFTKKSDPLSTFSLSIPRIGLSDISDRSYADTIARYSNAHSIDLAAIDEYDSNLIARCYNSIDEKHFRIYWSSYYTNTIYTLEDTLKPEKIRLAITEFLQNRHKVQIQEKQRIEKLKEKRKENH